MIISFDSELTVQFNLTIEEAVIANAVFNHAGCSADGKFVAEPKEIGKTLNTHTRTISKLLDRCVAAGVLEGSQETGFLPSLAYKKIVLGIKPEAQTSLPTISAKVIKKNDPKEGYQYWADLWLQAFGTKLVLSNKRKAQIRARRKTFKAEEIYEAMKHRYLNDWYKTPEGQPHWGNWESFWRSDEKIQNYLSRKPVNTVSTNEHTHNIGNVIRG